MGVEVEVEVELEVELEGPVGADMATRSGGWSYTMSYGGATIRCTQLHRIVSYRT